MALGSGYWDIGELLAAARTSEHQPAAAHVASSRKFGGEEELLSENLQQRFDVFRRGDAAQQNDLTVCPNPFGEQARVALEWKAISLVG